MEARLRRLRWLRWAVRRVQAMEARLRRLRRLRWAVRRVQAMAAHPRRIPRTVRPMRPAPPLRSGAIMPHVRFTCRLPRRSTVWWSLPQPSLRRVSNAADLARQLVGTNVTCQWPKDLRCKHCQKPLHVWLHAWESPTTYHLPPTTYRLPRDTCHISPGSKHDDGQWTVGSDHGPWSMVHGRWAIDHGRWLMVDG